MIAAAVRAGSVALDARSAARLDPDPVGRARAASWIAGNLLAARGVRVTGATTPTGAGVIGVRADGLTELLATVAALPALVDPSTLPVRWRLLLRVLGVPLLERAAADAVACGATVVRLRPP